jgi:DNA-3-methyladenine glycosylase I
MAQELAFHVRPIESSDSVWITPFMVAHWGAEQMLAHGDVYYPAKLPGFVATIKDEVVGLATFIIKNRALEIVSIDSDRPNQGIGSVLLNSLEEEAQQNSCLRVWMVTTNDNLNALRFYQKRGYRLVAVHYGAVTAARQVKPSIPLIGYEGIPLRDEIVLEKKL